MFLLVAPVVVVGVDVAAAEDVVAGFADDGDGVVGHEDQYGGMCVGDADAEVVESAAVAQGQFAELVDGVVADAEVCAGLAVGVGFGSGSLGLFGGGVSGVGAVRSLGVVDGAEGVQQCL